MATLSARVCHQSGIAIHMNSTSSIWTRRVEIPEPEDGLEASRSKGAYTDNAGDYAGHQWTLAGIAIDRPPRLSDQGLPRVLPFDNPIVAKIR